MLVLSILLVTLATGVSSTVADDLAAAERAFDAATAKRDEAALRMAVHQYLSQETAAAADAIVEKGLLADDAWVEEVTREGLARAQGPVLERLCAIALEHANLRVRLQLHTVLAHRKSVLAYRTVLSGLYDPKHEVAIAAVDALAKKNDIRCVPTLIDALDHYEKDGWDNSVIAWKIRHLLGYMTGEDFIPAKEWQRFWKRHGKRIKKPQQGKRIKDLERKGISGVGPRREYPRFFGIEILSQRIVFLLDVSQSMRDADPGPGDPPDRKRIDRLKAEARRLISAIPPGTKFTVIAFSSDVDKLSGSLLEATESNKSRAFKFIGGFEAHGQTHTDEALKAAFAIRDTRTIFLLSDGAPVRDTKAIDIREILDWLKGENRFRKIRIHTVGFAGTRDSIGTFLRDVARQNDGIFRELP